jgi:hypothetical protein
MHILLSAISYPYLAPKFIMLPTCCYRSYLLIPNWNRARIEFLSVDLLFRCIGPDLSVSIRTSLPNLTSPPLVGIVCPIRTCLPPARLVQVSQTNGLN